MSNQAATASNSMMSCNPARRKRIKKTSRLATKMASLVGFLTVLQKPSPIPFKMVFRSRHNSAKAPAAISDKIHPRPWKPHNLMPSVSAATAIIPSPKPQASCSAIGIRALNIESHKSRSNQMPINAVRKGNKNAMTMSRRESNQLGLTGSLMGMR